MSLTAGAITLTLANQTTAILAVAAATGGTGPYTYQWYRSTTTGFTPGSGNILSGATALTLNDSGLQPNTTYYYKNIVTDTGNSNVTATSTQLAVLTEPAQSQNQFALSPIVGLVDLKLGPTNVVSCQVASTVTTQIYPGQAVVVSAGTNGGPPQVQPIASKSDAVIGFAVYNIKDIQYVAGQMLEVAMWGTVIWCFATGAITQFQRVCADPTYVGGVQATGNSATIVGWAYDGAAAAGPIRVMLMPNAAYTTA